MRKITAIVCFLIFSFSSVVFGVRMSSEEVTINSYPSAHNAEPSYHYDYFSSDRHRDKFKGRIGHPSRKAAYYGVYHQHYPYITFETKAPYHNKFDHKNVIVGAE